MIRRLKKWLRRFRVDDQIALQGLEYDEESGKMKLKP
jgi:hypothetical protein